MSAPYPLDPEREEAEAARYGLGNMEPIGGYVSTTDATTTTIWSGAALATDEMCIVDAVISAFHVTEAEAAVYRILGQAWDNGGVITAQSSIYATVESDAALTVSFSVIGSTPRLRVTGTASNYQWNIEMGFAIYRLNA